MKDLILYTDMITIKVINKMNWMNYLIINTDENKNDIIYDQAHLIWRFVDDKG